MELGNAPKTISTLESGKVELGIATKTISTLESLESREVELGKQPKTSRLWNPDNAELGKTTKTISKVTPQVHQNGAKSGPKTVQGGSPSTKR